MQGQTELERVRSSGLGPKVVGKVPAFLACGPGLRRDKVSPWLGMARIAEINVLSQAAERRVAGKATLDIRRA